MISMVKIRTLINAALSDSVCRSPFSIQLVSEYIAFQKYVTLIIHKMTRQYVALLDISSPHAGGGGRGGEGGTD